MTALPDYSHYFHRAAGFFFDSEPPTLSEHWRATAERRHLSALAMEAGLPADAAPELVLLLMKDDKGKLITHTDLANAEAACFTIQ